MITTWRKEITRAMGGRADWRHTIALPQDSWENIIGSTLTDTELDFEFNSGYGSEEGKPFTLWTKDYVYFPVQYDGAEWVGRTPRNPNGEPTCHQGGG